MAIFFSKTGTKTGAKSPDFREKWAFLIEYLFKNAKNRAFMRLFCIIARFWCGRQELKTYDDTKKALIFKAFLLLNANVDAEIFLGRYDIAGLI